MKYLSKIGTITEAHVTLPYVQKLILLKSRATGSSTMYRFYEESSPSGSWALVRTSHSENPLRMRGKKIKHKNFLEVWKARLELQLRKNFPYALITALHLTIASL